MKKTFTLTATGVKELEQELKRLIAERGPIAQRIKVAREFGDLSENAEYSSARQEQGQVESRISELDHILKNVSVIEPPKDGNTVELGNTVRLKGDKGDKEFTIVGSVEADPFNGKISNESPIGQAMLGKKLGETVEIKTPGDTTTYKIKSIS